ncbi:hypothetical protein DFS34DRAFT_616832 [Phlyctochytrium arcticum]|nr:hypothetical protein DFS34DRAFT_616832 [Phlyctochytrium arcticum]
MPGQLAEPVLTVAFQNIQKLTSINESDLQTIWNVFTKCKDNLENGRRLENISWRLWYRSCHGHAPRDDDSLLFLHHSDIPLLTPPTPPAPVPTSTTSTTSPTSTTPTTRLKYPHVSPESFNRLLKTAAQETPQRKPVLPVVSPSSVAVPTTTTTTTTTSTIIPCSIPHVVVETPTPAVVVEPVIQQAVNVKKEGPSPVLFHPRPVRHYTAPHTPSACNTPQPHHIAPAAPQQFHKHRQPYLNHHAHAADEKPKVKFFISQSQSPDAVALQHPRPLPVASKLAPLVPARPLPPTTTSQSIARATVATLDKNTIETASNVTATAYDSYNSDEDDEDFSDSDFSSDFSDSEDTYSDEEGETYESESDRHSRAIYAQLFRKVDLASAASTRSTLSSKPSLLSVALRQGSCLKRAKPSQFRNLNAMASSSSSNMSPSSPPTTTALICSDISESLRENLATEQRMMPLNMRYARGGTGGTDVYHEDGFW